MHIHSMTNHTTDTNNDNSRCVYTCVYTQLVVHHTRSCGIYESTHMAYIHIPLQHTIQPYISSITRMHYILVFICVIQIAHANGIQHL